MKLKLLLISLGLLLSTAVSAIPVTVNMTGDNIINGGGLCFDSSCTNGTGWASLGPIPNASNWPASDSLVLDLTAGTHYFAWHVDDTGGPEGLLAEILWGTGANYSSSAWEVYDVNTGSFIELATDLGANSSHPIWGTIAGISSNAHWIWGSNRSSGADDIWIRTSVTLREDVRVSEPGILALIAGGLLGLAFVRRVKQG